MVSSFLGNFVCVHSERNLYLDREIKCIPNINSPLKSDTSRLEETGLTFERVVVHFVLLYTKHVRKIVSTHNLKNMGNYSTQKTKVYLEM